MREIDSDNQLMDVMNEFELKNINTIHLIINFIPLKTIFPEQLELHPNSNKNSNTQPNTKAQCQHNNLTYNQVTLCVLNPHWCLLIVTLTMRHTLKLIGHLVTLMGPIMIAQMGIRVMTQMGSQ